MTTSPAPGAWRSWGLLAIGVILASTGAIVANQFDLGRNLEMDLKGVKVLGRVESWPSGEGYRLSYTHPSGTRYSTSYRKPIHLREQDEGRIELVYLPADPQKFQPAGLSYVPGAAAFGLFALGMAGILRARRTLTLRYRAPVPPDPRRTR